MDLLVEVIKAVAENIDSDDDDDTTEDDSGEDTDSQSEDTTEDDDDEDDSDEDDENEDGFDFGELKKEHEQSKSQAEKGSSEKKRGKPVRGLEMPERVANSSMFMMKREKTDAEELVEGAIEVMSLVGAIGQQMQGQGVGPGRGHGGGQVEEEEEGGNQAGSEVVELPPIPPSGMRLPLDTTSQTPFPDSETTGDPTLRDLDGTPIFLGSALLEKSVQPCKIIVKPGPQIAVSVPYSQAEYPHNGRYDLLLFIPDQMEWVETRQGRIPKKRKPVEGGFEEDGMPLYHGLVNVNGHFVPGKCGEHLNGCVVSWQGAPYVFVGHRILCWVKGFMEEQIKAQKELEKEKELEKTGKESEKEL